MQALLFGVAAWSTVFVGACATRYLSVLTDSPDEGPTEVENTSDNIAFLPEKHGAPWLPPLRACVLPASRALPLRTLRAGYPRGTVVLLLPTESYLVVYGSQGAVAIFTIKGMPPVQLSVEPVPQPASIPPRSSATSSKTARAASAAESAAVGTSAQAPSTFGGFGGAPQQSGAPSTFGGFGGAPKQPGAAAPTASGFGGATQQPGAPPTFGGFGGAPQQPGAAAPTLGLPFVPKSRETQPPPQPEALPTGGTIHHHDHHQQQQQPDQVQEAASQEAPPPFQELTQPVFERKQRASSNAAIQPKSFKSAHYIAAADSELEQLFNQQLSTFDASLSHVRLSPSLTDVVERERERDLLQS